MHTHAHAHAHTHTQLKDEVVSLVDVIAPPDHILQAPIGMSSGEVSNKTELGKKWPEN